MITNGTDAVVIRGRSRMPRTVQVLIVRLSG